MKDLRPGRTGSCCMHLHTAVLGNLAKYFNANFSACMKFHVENEWEISHMS